MGHQPKHTDQQDQDSSTVLQVVVQLPGHPAQTQQAHHLQRAEQTADALREEEMEMEETGEGGGRQAFKEKQFIDFRKQEQQVH